ncbi:MAG: 16S rRNA (uracil(1498)-N(3))-methyltransferase [Pseudomonadota bacterium]
MPIHDFNAQRLFVDHDLSAGQIIECPSEQVNYLVNVLRLKSDDTILVFNGRDGEWRARVREAVKRRCVLELGECVRAQTKAQALHYYFAPLKKGRLDYMVQKAVELGVSHFHPVMTQRTVADRVKLERMRGNAVEAAEQCGVLSLPDISEPKKLTRVLDDWRDDQPLIFCDELAEVANPIKALSQVESAAKASAPLSVLIGPEGGFSANERERLLKMPSTCAISLGPRIMRADTAAVAALSLVNAVLGDWC